ncbi:glycosyltransferase family 2 protein [Paraglaciecola chathamensis]|uniref:Glycosyltransferase family 2 protein n=1 Tax=Paraglaciecola chathamensis TaxID=368405 RepID=A0ABS0WAE4_9ALTE|nr:glycosyltransferase family A protein [Paraglaciecola chathamensis]MBJ2135080.1 glycosyltransferase family 2 protein [Paraglaciecola chathamensis]
MEKNELVSCIITTFNRPDLVSFAIDSVLKQSYTCVELFIINDCSTKSYSDVIEKYSRYTNVSFHRNENNLGLSASRNKGLSLSNGKYIAFLDDDDIWLPSKLKEQVNILREYPDYVACSSSHIESESNKLVKNTKDTVSLNDLLGANIIGPPSKVLVKKSRIESIRFDENAKHAEDWDFYLQLLIMGPIYMLEQPLIIYNTSHFGRMTTGFSSLSIEDIQVKSNMTYKNKELIGDKNFRFRMASYYFAGFLKRKNKTKFLLNIIKEVGLAMTISTFLKMTSKAFKK